MSIFIQDTARNNLVKWTSKARRESLARGAVISPFTSPVIATPSGYKAGAQQTVDKLHEAGCEVWFDPMTHVLQMDNVGDWRYYDQWNLWPGLQRGSLDSEHAMREHVKAIFRVQDLLGVPRLAPTILLHSPQSQVSVRALDLAHIAADEDPGAAQAICGDSNFWSGGDDLDAHIGALAQTAPGQWFLSVARAVAVLPVPAGSHEIAGLCRASRSLGDNASVHISHGDLASLPAVAAGATSVGTGWDVRQRVLAYSDFQERDPSAEGGQWYKRPTLEGLLGSLTNNEFALLESRNRELAYRLLPGLLAPTVQDIFLHHIRVLGRIIQELRGYDFRQSYGSLVNRYERASQDWSQVAPIVGSNLNSSHWIEQFAVGLQRYGATESW